MGKHASSNLKITANKVSNTEPSYYLNKRCEGFCTGMIDSREGSKILTGDTQRMNSPGFPST